jgi:single-strand DNA-binding protein
MNTNTGVIIGNLVRDAELKFVPSSGLAIADFTVAVNGMKDDDVSFIPVTAFGKTAEAVGNYTQKGSKVAVSYYLKMETWTSKEGKNRSKLKCNATRVEFLSGGQKKESKDDLDDLFEENDNDDIFQPSDDDDIPF